MNVLVSSSRQWNPGDEFIWHGIRFLLEQLIGHGHSYILWNRNPDLFKNSWADASHKPTFLSNCCVIPPLAVCDLVVFAGTPEWCGPSVELVYKELLIHRHVPVLFLGLGMPGYKLQEYELEVLKSERSLVCARAEDSFQLLKSNGVEQALHLPCPAMFSGCFQKNELFTTSGDDVSPEAENLKIGLVLQSSVVANQSIKESLVQECLNVLQTYPECDVICNYMEEWTRFSLLLKGSKHRVRYVFDALDYPTLHLDYDVIIATRLHSSIQCLSLGIPTCLIADASNGRIRGTAGTFGDLLPVYDDANEAFEKVENWNLSDIRSKIELFQVGVQETYLRIIKKHLSRFDLL